MNKFIIISIISIIGILLLFFYYYRIREHFDNGSSSKTVIPLNIFQTWKTKDLPPKMKEYVGKLRSSNSEFHYTLMDDDECEDFIEENFPEEVITAYLRLIPGAYKADLWRYCILYTYGGIYLDIKYHNISDFKFIRLTDKEYFCKDRPDKCVYNAFIVCKKGNSIMKQCIDGIVENVKNKYYGENALCPTGPGLLGRFFTEEERNHLEINHIGDNKILFNGEQIIDSYPEYRDEQKGKGYTNLWLKKEIYN